MHGQSSRAILYNRTSPRSRSASPTTGSQQHYGAPAQLHLAIKTCAVPRHCARTQASSKPPKLASERRHQSRTPPPDVIMGKSQKIYFSTTNLVFVMQTSQNYQQVEALCKPVWLSKSTHLVHKWSHHFIQLVQNAIDDLHQQVTFLKG